MDIEHERTKNGATHGGGRALGQPGCDGYLSAAYCP